MRTTTPRLVRISFFFIALCCATLLTANNVEVRFVEERLSDNTLQVNIEVRSAQGADLVLASQNYRFYYNTEVLSLNEEAASTLLPKETYGPVYFETRMENVEANVGQLDFDSNLGFANLSIDMLDPSKGASAINAGQEWTKVMALQFDVIGEGAYHLVWGREAKTDKYATAFVQFGAWQGNNDVKEAQIENYGDLSGNMEEDIFEDALIAVGPNPTSDYINVTLSKKASATTKVNVIDMKGQVVAEAAIKEGSVSESVDLSSMTAGQYIIQIIDNETRQQHQQPVILAK